MGGTSMKAQRNYPTVTITRKGENAIVSGHPWVYEGEVTAVSGQYENGDLVDVVSQSKRNIFPVVDSKNHFQGYVSLEDIRSVMFKYESYDSLHVYNFMKSAPAYVYVNERMDRVMTKFEQTGAWNLPVVTDDRTYVGFISKSKIFSSYREQLKQVSHD